jgi:hypothetical protein
MGSSANYISSLLFPHREIARFAPTHLRTYAPYAPYRSDCDVAKYSPPRPLQLGRCAAVITATLPLPLPSTTVRSSKRTSRRVDEQTNRRADEKRSSRVESSQLSSTRILRNNQECLVESTPRYITSPHPIYRTPYRTPYTIHHTPYTIHHTLYTIYHTIHHTTHTTHHTPHTTSQHHNTTHHNRRRTRTAVHVQQYTLHTSPYTHIHRTHTHRTHTHTHTPHTTPQHPLIPIAGSTIFAAPLTRPKVTKAKIQKAKSQRTKQKQRQTPNFKHQSPNTKHEIIPCRETSWSPHPAAPSSLDSYCHSDLPPKSHSHRFIAFSRSLTYTQNSAKLQGEGAEVATTSVPFRLHPRLNRVRVCSCLPLSSATEHG